ncbi:class I SAM-dependent methyltransferase [Bifidobacterium simiiventris]|uniref:class I SAM-dependent methyltransferase n=1 Tax=Bifidobacterium simiiventris TaxID=2834434 RepID=UPI001C5921E6|nr:class I SAM-dependent methyltransferase [Bifidobacterium simiiventris]MBW3079156.1 SAM-dependent methyltransferase [Bifidobacterium simiiventris]
MLISPETARFVAEHRLENVRDLALKAKRADGLDLPFALDQIAGWQTARGKLPQWAACEGIVYPPHISMEQCSSEFTARYKAEVARRIVGESRAADGRDTAGEPQAVADGSVHPGTMIDLTGGFGVDFSYTARGFARAIYVERQEHLCALAEHNMHALGLDHVTVVNGDAEAVLGDVNTLLRSGGVAFDEAQGVRSPTRCAGAPSAEGAEKAEKVENGAISLIFLDPARRDEHGGRTVAIEDCTPNVLALRDRLLAAAPHVMIKLSPMLDWRKAVADFRGAVSEVHIVSTGNECKELLLVLDRTANATVRVHCVNDADRLDYDYGVVSNGATSRIRGTAREREEDFSTSLRSARNDSYGASSAASDRALGLAPLPERITYLYEPNASIMKAGCFALVEDRYGLTQIGPNSHLFVSGSDRPITDFPGRAFAVETVTTMGKKELKSALAGVAKANVAVRNFPLTVAQLRKKLRLSDGGDTYLFATTLAGAKHVILRCHKA